MNNQSELKGHNLKEVRAMTKNKDRGVFSKGEGSGRKCPTCGSIMERWVHSPEWFPLIGRGYYRYWDKCVCGHLQHYEKAHVRGDKVARLQSEYDARKAGLITEIEGLIDGYWGIAVSDKASNAASDASDIRAAISKRLALLADDESPDEYDTRMSGDNSWYA